MGNYLAKCSRQQKEAFRLGRQYHCSGQEKARRPDRPHQAPRSYAANPGQVSFLNLPGELRNRIYSQLLVFDDYVRVTVKQPTRVPSLVLLQACKQVHEEAASLFYSANSFYVQVEESMFVSANTKLQDLDFATMLLQPPRLEPKSADELPMRGGAFFPAPQYHMWLTRLAIDVKIRVLDEGGREKCECCGLELADPTMRPWQMQEQIGEGMDGVYRKMMERWEAKHCRWEGRLHGWGNEWWRHSGVHHQLRGGGRRSEPQRGASSARGILYTS